MSKLKLTILRLYLIALVLMCLFVPWKGFVPSGNMKLPLATKYSFIGIPPKVKIGDYKIPFVTVDMDRVILEAIAVTAVATLAYLISYKKFAN